ncbi:MAG TPA: haloacid dehalogenase, partial [Lactobacillus sp.]|nr:haloacid dehalogenase [Lactobacillus sp.]
MLVNAIWDFDGMLYDSYPGMMKALRSLVLDNGGQIEPDALYRLVKKTRCSATMPTPFKYV